MQSSADMTPPTAHYSHNDNNIVPTANTTLIKLQDPKKRVRLELVGVRRMCMFESFRMLILRFSNGVGVFVPLEVSSLTPRTAVSIVEVGSLSHLLRHLHDLWLWRI